MFAEHFTGSQNSNALADIMGDDIFAGCSRQYLPSVSMGNDTAATTSSMRLRSFIFQFM
jgi:hypothetical protein